jgi:hypothetical protein
LDFDELKLFRFAIKKFNNMDSVDSQATEEKYAVFLLHLKQPQPVTTQNVGCLGGSMCGHAGWSCANCIKRGFQGFQTLILTKEQLEITIKSSGQEIVPGTPIDDYIDDLVQDGISKVFSEQERAIVSVVRLSDGYVWGDFGHRYL